MGILHPNNKSQSDELSTKKMPDDKDVDEVDTNPSAFMKKVFKAKVVSTEIVAQAVKKN